MFRIFISALWGITCISLNAENFLKKENLFTKGNKQDSIQPLLTRDRYVLGNTAISYASQIEERLSPLLYSGLGFQTSIGYEKLRGSNQCASIQRYHAALANYALTNFISTPLMNARIYATRINLTYQYSKRIYKATSNGMEVFFGGETSMIALNRRHGNFYNNALAYSCFLGIGGCGEIRYPFEAFKRDWELTINGQLSMLGLRVQQAYGSVMPKGFLDPGIKTLPATMQSIEGAGLWNFISTSWRWQMRYYLRNKNFISVGTSSNFHNSPGKEGTKYRLAETGIQLGGGFAF